MESIPGAAPIQAEPALPQVGRLLVAAPLLTDPNFRGTVVLLLDHDDDGTLGVILNRPSQVAVESVLTSWPGRRVAAPVLYAGGPVADDSALGIGELGEAAGEAPVGFRPVLGSVGLVDLDADEMPLRAMRIFAGYSGWDADQLNAEIAEGAWYVVESNPADVFTADPGRLWQRVVARQAGDLALLANRTEDPSHN